MGEDDKRWLENARKEFCPKVETPTDRAVDEWLQWIARSDKPAFDEQSVIRGARAIAGRVG